jgi:hypothetical protein
MRSSMYRRRKCDNKSGFYRDWSTQYLKKQTRAYDEIITGYNACYGVKDLRIYHGICSELEHRGIEILSVIKFSR